mmetsp:Transcript_7929/g.17699  ORF Transcript_7929/g.17699 Transcript_7929/m.17699 type:complete len:92 (+) Transcript_7929:135-410(+)
MGRASDEPAGSRRGGADFTVKNYSNNSNRGGSQSSLHQQISPLSSTNSSDNDGNKSLLLSLSNNDSYKSNRQRQRKDKNKCLLYNRGLVWE